MATHWIVYVDRLGAPHTVAAAHGGITYEQAKTLWGSRSDCHMPGYTVVSAASATEAMAAVVAAMLRRPIA